LAGFFSPFHIFISSKNSDAGSTLVTSKWSRARVQATISRSLEENNRHFNEARERLEKWAEDMILASEKELKDTKQQINALNRQARLASTVAEQHELQEKIRELEKKKRRQRQHIFDLEDEIAQKRDDLISALERRMTQKTSLEPLFTIAWKVTWLCVSLKL